MVKDLINKGVNKEDAIEKAAEEFKLRVDYLTRYVNKRIDEAEIKSDAQRKAIYATKAKRRIKRWMVVDYLITNQKGTIKNVDQY